MQIYSVENILYSVGNVLDLDFIHKFILVCVHPGPYLFSLFYFSMPYNHSFYHYLYCPDSVATVDSTFASICSCQGQTWCHQRLQLLCQLKGHRSLNHGYFVLIVSWPVNMLLHVYFFFFYLKDLIHSICFTCVCLLQWLYFALKCITSRTLSISSFLYIVFYIDSSLYWWFYCMFSYLQDLIHSIFSTLLS